MIFGATPLAEAEGAILAHSLNVAGRRLKKGTRLAAADIAALEEAGLREVVAARPGPGDVHEDEAARRVAAALAPDPAAAGLTVSAPFTGRVNLYAAAPGVLRVDAGAISRLNAADEAITVATLADHARADARQMVATVKIIPYAVPEASVVAALRLLAAPALRVHPVARRAAALILTRVTGMKEKVLAKGAEAVRARLASLGLALAREEVVAHETDALALALAAAPGDLVLILTGSATSDRGDVGPAALVAAGGRIERFGMPVDPGNLLFLGDLGGRAVLGLPGCARSPRLNGADWVLERLAAGIAVTGADIAAMGVGGLLKEIPSRPAPRTGGATAPARPVVSGLLLAAGASSRMAGRDKLLEAAGDGPMIARAARTLVGAQIDEVVAVLRPGDAARAAALAGTGARIVENPRAAEGMGTSIAAGLAALRPDADAVLVMLADMPGLTPAGLDRLIAGFDPGEGRAILRAVTPEGRPGHPVLFGRRFFEALARLEGDEGARAIVAEHSEFVTSVVVEGAATDLDTPEDWAAWRAVSARPGSA